MQRNNSSGLLCHARKFAGVVTASLFLTLLSPGCGNKPADRSAEEAGELFRRSAALTRRYTDSLKSARDSVRISALSEAHDKAVTELNFEYRPDTDHAMTEGQNDTLAAVTLRYIQVRDSVLASLDSLGRR